jgi:glycerol-3-phosphate acyltransferase PlsY
VLIGLNLWTALIFCGLWLIVAATTRYSSLSALIASLSAPAALWWLGEGQMAELAILLTILLWWKHRENISRLVSGTESRIGKKRDEHGNSE